MSTLILLRHGRSDWNEKNLFTGWVDVDLIDKGREEAVRGGRLIKESGLLPDVVHTSVLRRARRVSSAMSDSVCWSMWPSGMPAASGCISACSPWRLAMRRASGEAKMRAPSGGAEAGLSPVGLAPSGASLTRA